jgi:hypothetical protein
VVIAEITADGEVTESRDDKHALASLAHRGGGVLLRVEGLPSKRVKALRTVALGLVRPVRIDHVRLLGLPRGKALAVPDVLSEGQGFAGMLRLKRAPRRVVLVGRIWARRFRRVIRVSKRFSRATASFVFSHDQHGELSRTEMKQLALLGRAVSPVTSYLAIEPGVRPSKAGLDRDESGEDALGALVGNSWGWGSGSGGLGLGRRTPRLDKLIAPAVRRCKARFRPPAGWQLRLTVETTYDEIVAVNVRGPRGRLRRCILKVVWQTRLSGPFVTERDTFPITIH